MEKVWAPPPPSPLSPSSREKGQVDGAICGLQAGHKTVPLWAQKPSIITDTHTNANNPRVPECCACWAICTVGPCGPRGYPLLDFIYLLGGVRGQRRLNTARKLMKFIAFIFAVWCINPKMSLAVIFNLVLPTFRSILRTSKLLRISYLFHPALYPPAARIYLDVFYL